MNKYVLIAILLLAFPRICFGSFYATLICLEQPNSYSVTTVCPGQLSHYEGGLHETNCWLCLFNISKIVWTCGGAGEFSNGSQTCTQLGSDNYLGLQNVQWHNGSGSLSWVQVTYYFTDFFMIKHTESWSLQVNIGVSGAPDYMNCPSSLCLNNNRSYLLTTTSVLPTGSTDYIWSSTNATISNAGPNTNIPGSHATLTCIAANNNPITVTLKYYSSVCNVYSPAYTRVISRIATPPTGYPTMTAAYHGGSADFTFHPSSNGSGVEYSSDNSNWQSFVGAIERLQGTSQVLWARTVNDCGHGPSTIFHLSVPACPNCPK